MSKTCTTAKELADAIKNSEDEIIVEGDLKKGVLRIKATGKVAWGVCAVALTSAIAFYIATPGATISAQSIPSKNPSLFPMSMLPCWYVWRSQEIHTVLIPGTNLTPLERSPLLGCIHLIQTKTRRGLPDITGIEELKIGGVLDGTEQADPANQAPLCQVSL